MKPDTGHEAKVAALEAAPPTDKAAAFEAEHNAKVLKVRNILSPAEKAEAHVVHRGMDQ